MKILRTLKIPDLLIVAALAMLFSVTGFLELTPRSQAQQPPLQTTSPTFLSNQAHDKDLRQNSFVRFAQMVPDEHQKLIKQNAEAQNHRLETVAPAGFW